MLQAALQYGIPAGYATVATALAIAAARQSWRQGRRAYAIFAYAVAVLAVAVGVLAVFTT